MKNSPSFLGLKLQNFKDAFRALFWIFKNESHFRVQCFGAVLALLIFYFCKASMNDYFGWLFFSALILALEVLNTAIEKICNLIEPRPDQRIALIKEASSAAVLLGSLASVIFFSLTVWKLCFMF